MQKLIVDNDNMTVLQLCATVSIMVCIFAVSLYIVNRRFNKSKS